MNKQNLMVEISVTDFCNMRCTYCFEVGKYGKVKAEFDKEKYDKLVEDIFSDPVLGEKYGSITFTLWGGEPTVNMPFIRDLFENFKDDERISFFMYTNGFYLDEFIEFYNTTVHCKCIGQPRKFSFQISYDGKATHGKARVGIDGKDTSPVIEKNIRTAIALNIPFSLKATLEFQSIDKMHENYMSFVELFEYAFEADKKNPRINYALTMDHLSANHVNVPENWKELLGIELVKIIKEEIKLKEKYGQSLFSMLESGNKAICGAGKSLIHIAGNGDILPCHGTNYSPFKNELTISNAFTDDKYIEKIKDMMDKFSATHTTLPQECKDCYSISCLKCNIKKYDNSKKETFEEKWTDYTNQPLLCEFYKEFSKYMMAFKKKMQEIENKR